MPDHKFMSDLKRALFERPLTTEEIQSHEESGEGFHVPVIIHRTGGISAKLLNCCGICGAQIVPVAEYEWVPISDEYAESMRNGRVPPPRSNTTPGPVNPPAPSRNRKVSRT